MSEQTFDEHFDALGITGQYRFWLNYYRMRTHNEMSKAKFWRSQGRYGAMHSRLIAAHLASEKARLCLREIRRLET